MENDMRSSSWKNWKVAILFYTDSAKKYKIINNQ